LQCFKDTVNAFAGEYGSKMLKLGTDEIEVKVRRTMKSGAETLRLASSSLKMNMLLEEPDPVTGNPLRWEEVSATAPSEKQPASLVPTRKSGAHQAKRVAARRTGSMYVYDLPGLLNVALSAKFTASRDRSSSPMLQKESPAAGGRKRSPSPRRSGVTLPADLLCATELIMDWDKMELVESDRVEGSNDIGMIAWRISLKTFEYPDGRDVVVIANDVTFQAGSFGVREDQLFQKASEYARNRGIPRIYISCNSGARVGVVEELKPLFKIHWIDSNDPSKGFEYLYLDKVDYEKLQPNTVHAHLVTVDGADRYIIDAIIGEHQQSTKGGIGVENLQGSGLIAGETSRAYNETFTLSYITGRSVGIGAYLNRLGQRNIQMVSSPMILTGYSALNKLLGKNVYSSQDQLGGPQIMVPNGVTHQVVRDDREGLAAILDWLSFVPKDVRSLPPMHQPSAGDPWDRDVDFVPSKQPYDPRDFIRGTISEDGSRLRGFFDAGSFIEYLEGWGQTVVIGRARLGGIPMGVIAVETRSVERFIPADPANPESSEVVEQQAGQVWFPDSAFKTAQALCDFNRAENLPVMIFANWRGFSGGTRDMYSEVLKYGAQIVDAFVNYEHPIFIYIPPNGELRGGAWVVIDPSINPEKMELYADPESRGGILEPPGVVEVKYRAAQQIEAMHRLDDRIKELNAKIAGADGAEKKALEQELKARERNLLPLYTSVAIGFADLHDRTGRMKAKGVILDDVAWKNSRRFFFWRVKRRVLQDFFIKSVRAVDKRLDHAAALAKVKKWAEESSIDFNNNEQMAAWLEAQDMSKKADACKTAYLRAEIEAALKELPEDQRRALVASLQP